MDLSADAPIYRGHRPRYDAVLLSITERCHVGCAHCGFIGAKREREATLQELADWSKQVCDYGIDRLILTGGEPFERLDAVELVVKTATNHVPIISIFTSSFWGTTKDDAIYVLRRLQGLNHLYLSSDVYHQKRVPYKNVQNVIAAAVALGIPYITICITYGNEAELKEVKENYREWYDVITFYEDRVIPTPYLPKSVLARQASGKRVSPEIYARTCYLQTPLVNPNGDVFACHTGKAAAHRDIKKTPYYLGSLRENSFQSIAEAASRRWDYQFLRTHGPRGVAEVLAEHPEALVASGRSSFTSPCDMCFSVLKTSEGTASLQFYCQKDAVRDMIDMRLAIGLGEDPLSE
ncbi:radical SAM protein [Caballeronia sp. GAFFF3]|uniref:radical SAM protein n=1 Tax=Caballeronia sp. GAFFF3 TaxID=2921759 RepID=UPI002028B2E1|nr:radical SAM protein [Caballeronia sp. GAFFF3]